MQIPENKISLLTEKSSFRYILQRKATKNAAVLQSFPSTVGQEKLFRVLSKIDIYSRTLVKFETKNYHWQSQFKQFQTIKFLMRTKQRHVIWFNFFLQTAVNENVFWKTNETNSCAEPMSENRIKGNCFWTLSIFVSRVFRANHQSQHNIIGRHSAQKSFRVRKCLKRSMRWIRR